MRTDGPQQTTQNPQSGMALLMVLGIVAATTLLAAHMMTVTETLAKQTAVAVVTSQLNYQCESAVELATWMHLTDRRLVTSRTLGASQDNRSQFTDFEPWMMDGMEHRIDDNCSVYIKDAIKGFSIQNIEALKDTVDLEDQQAQENINIFIDVYKDYVDSNDLLNLYGKERENYAAEGFPTLPRNENMRFKAEIFWLENWKEAISGDITVIPPKGITLKGEKGAKPNFFTASEQQIREVMEQKAMKVSEMDILTAIEARRKWQESATPLEELLPGELLINLKNYFSFDESDYAEITATATAYNGTIQVRKTVTREVNIKSKSAFADRDDQTFSLWEVRNF